MNFRKPGHAIVVDARCLQDPNYAGRGVGRHSLALLRGKPHDEAQRLIALIDPSLPNLMEDALGLFDAVHTNAYAAHDAVIAPREGPIAYLSMSPMTHDPLHAARILGDSALVRVAVVYDFIPRRHGTRYLPTAADRVEYTNRLQWLATSDLFAPISQTTADELVSLLGPLAGRVTVTGAALDPGFEPNRCRREETARRHIIVVGGDDPRKNPEAIVRAHARSVLLQGSGIPLLIAGNYRPEQAQRLRELSETCGGRPELVETLGYVPEGELVALYRTAKIVACASTDEGFSLPIVEGMAAGAVAVASDIPAHAELVPSTRRCLPDDYASFRALLEHAWFDDRWRHNALAEQNEVWPRFRAADVAHRFWAPITAMLRRAATKQTILRHRQPRIAVLSPLPPERSGVADYTAATLAELGKVAEVHAFTETANPSNVPNIAHLRPLDATPFLLPTFDRVIAVLGNSQFHLRIFELLLSYGSAAIAHDARMLGFYRVLLGEERTVKEASRELGREVLPGEIQTWLHDENTTKAFFLGEIASAASPMIVHSPITAEIISKRYQVRPTLLPFCIYRPWSARELSVDARAAARRRLSIADDEIAIVTFGFVHQSKAPADCIWSLKVLRNWNIPASLHFVGGLEHSGDNGASLVTLAEHLGIERHIRFFDEFVTKETYSDYLLAADLAIQLRTYELGGLSGALLDCSAAGLPTVANASLANAVGAPSAYVRAIPDALSPVLLAEALAELIDSGANRARVGEERDEFCRERSFGVYAQHLLEALHL